MPKQDALGMEASGLLRQAIQKARMGHDLTARDMFLDVVRLDPDNEVAWVWLIGLLDPLEDRITACERVLTINPANHEIRKHYDTLLGERAQIQRKAIDESEKEYQEACKLAQKNRTDEALSTVSHMLLKNETHEAGWMLYAELASDADNKIRAYQNVLGINPSNAKAQEEIVRLRHFKDHPLDLAACYEEEGHLDEALDVYRALAYQVDRSGFDKIFKEIVRLEDLKYERIQHISASVTVARLSAGVPLLYIAMVLLHVGLQPVRFFTPHLWMGVPWVVIGGFFIALASVRSRHVIWKKLFNDQGGGGSRGARTLVMLTGWILILLPFLILLWDSYTRLVNFVPPPPPF